MSRQYSCGLLLTFFCLFLNAQEVVLSGKVVDSTGQGLELANLMVFEMPDKKIAAYGVTDTEGRFRFPLKNKGSYMLKASFLGFETYEESLSVEEERHLEITLSAVPNQLEGVEVVHELPISVSGDTIVYKADAFTTGKERKLAQVLEQLPGFEVDDEGQVKVQGKEVSSVLVEGKEFFDGDTKMATQNIPADAVDKVQLLQNFNDVGPLGGVNSSEALALNIKLKEGMKNIWFGDLMAGAGDEERYTSHANLFYNSPKLSLNFIGDANNLGKQAFTLNDYFRFNGGFSSLSGSSGGGLRLSQDDIGLSFMQNNRARSIDSKLGALNLNYNPNKKWTLSGFGIVSDTKTDMLSSSKRTYIGQEGQTENLNRVGTLSNRAVLGKFSTVYKPSGRWHWEYNGFLKGSAITDEIGQDSKIGEQSNRLESSDARDPFSFEQRLSAFFAKNESHIFSLEMNHNYREGLTRLDLDSDEPLFAELITWPDDEAYRLGQQNRAFTQSFDLLLNHYWVLDRTTHLNFKFGHNKLWQDYRTETWAADDNPPGFGNALRYEYSDSYLGLGFRKKWGKLTIHPALNLHRFRALNEQVQQKQEQSPTLLLPQLQAKFDFAASRSLSLTYRAGTQFEDAQQWAQGLVVSNYNTLFQGNPGLRDSPYHDLELHYFDFNMFNFTNTTLMLNYRKNRHALGNELQFLGLNRINRVFNLTQANESLRFNGAFEKRFEWLKTELSAELGYSKLHNQVNGQPDYNRSFNQTYELSVETLFKEAPNVEIGYRQLFNDYSSANTSDRFTTRVPFANAELYFLKSFTLTADYSHYNYKNRSGTTRTDYGFLNASLYFRADESPWEFKLEGLNLTDNREIRTDAFSQSIIGTTAYLVQPRYWALSITYEL
ncbi:TonB-dependent receptor [Sediminicola luteus]|uniref:TonB-dependent receptor n=1 Tax=Sediminicola luteus TaxID=319238 RepID=A0A2A4G5Q7_9FLAO|nr:carboxypeptidase-like regulatory domain-containing protein [Sediminicola luteus]PCE63316.1 hypothetical protein B7P33_13945 [Sediminicola luteus]